MYLKMLQLYAIFCTLPKFILFIKLIYLQSLYWYNLGQLEINRRLKKYVPMIP